MAVVVAAFFGYHVHLVARGRTTNEHYKWQALAKAKARRAPRPPPPPDGAADDGDRDGGGGSAGSSDSDAAVVDDGAPALPRNIYNRGAALNVSDVLVPRSTRPDALKRAAKAKRNAKAKAKAKERD